MSYDDDLARALIEIQTDLRYIKESIGGTPTLKERVLLIEGEVKDVKEKMQDKAEHNKWLIGQVITLGGAAGFIVWEVVKILTNNG